MRCNYFTKFISNGVNLSAKKYQVIFDPILTPSYIPLTGKDCVVSFVPRVTF